MRRFLYDTAIFVYALGGEHELRAPCQAIVRSAAEGTLAGEASAAMPQELANQRLRRTGDRGAAARAARYAAELCVIHPMEPEDVTVALGLFEEHAALDAMDAMFAAVALREGLSEVLSPDRAFDQVPGLERIDPADSDAVAALAV